MFHKKFAAIRLSTDILCFAIVIAATLFTKFAEPHNFGYFEADESLMYPFRPSTVSATLLHIVNCSAIIAAIVIIELIFFRYDLREYRYGIPIIFYAMYNIAIVAFFGYCSTALVTNVGKMTVGRLRPNFHEVCGPQAVTTSKLNFISEYTCGATVNKIDIQETKRSFPSGHSSLVAYTAIFLCVYLQRRLSFKNPFPFVRLFIQTVLCGLALYVCLSRIVDNKHHWSDVAAGIAIGVIIALCTPYFIDDLYTRQSEILLPFNEQSSDDDSGARQLPLNDKIIIRKDIE